jgi:membrane fusion protein
VISNLLANVGDATSASIPLLSILPNTEALKARLLVPSKALGKIEIGQEIMLSFDAYSYERYGVFKATVATIADTAVGPREQIFPVAMTEPVFIVDAVIEMTGVQRYSEIILRSSMSISAEVITGESTIASRLFLPIKYLGEKL